MIDNTLIINSITGYFKAYYIYARYSNTMSFDVNDFILSELHATEEKAVATDSYEDLGRRCYLLAYYIRHAHKVSLLKQETIIRMLQTMLLSYNRHYVPLVKEKATELFLAENPNASLTNTVDDEV